MRAIFVLSVLIISWLLWSSVYFFGEEIQATHDNAPKFDFSKTEDSRVRHEEWVSSLGPTSRQLKRLNYIRTVLIFVALVAMPVPAILALFWRKEFSSWRKKIVFILAFAYGWLAIPVCFYILLILGAGGLSSG